MDVDKHLVIWKLLSSDFWL